MYLGQYRVTYCHRAGRFTVAVTCWAIAERLKHGKGRVREKLWT